MQRQMLRRRVSLLVAAHSYARCASSDVSGAEKLGELAEARDITAEASGSADADDDSMPPAVPARFELETNYDLARFRATGTAPTGEGLVVQCDAGYHRRFRALDDSARQREAAAATAAAQRRLPRIARRRSADEPVLPVMFSVLVTNTVTRGLSLELLAASVNGALAIDGAVFHSDPSAVLDDSLEAWGAAKELYQGPQLQQRHLAQIALQYDGAPNPFVSHPQREKFCFSPYIGHETKYTKYGHQPVHTVPPAVYNAVARYAQDLGVDDALARFVHQHARHVQFVARKQWREEVAAVLAASRAPRHR